MPEIANVRQRLRGLQGIIWDNHGCMPLRADESFMPELERYAKAGVNVVSLNVGFAEIPWTDHLTVLAFMRRWIAQRPELYRLVGSVNDIRRCQLDGKLGVVFDIEGMCPVQDNLHLVQTFYELGVRWMLIAYNLNNKAGAGCLDQDAGLTDTGRAIIQEMERVGMVLCLSHTGSRTAQEALEYAKNPVVFSHSNPHGAHAHPRNISDQLMSACAATGGVVGLSGMGVFLGASTNLVERLLTQLRYVVDRVGPEHVGLGLDYVFDSAELSDYARKNPALFPAGFDATGGFPMVAPEDVPEIVEGLARDGLDDTQIRGILGENWLRVAVNVWK